MGKPIHTHKSRSAISDSGRGLNSKDTKEVTVTFKTTTNMAETLKSNDYRIEIQKRDPSESDDPTSDLILYNAIDIFNMPEIDLGDPVAVSRRLSEFFKMYADKGLKPTIAGMAMAVGLTRERMLRMIRSGEPAGHVTQETLQILEKALRVQESLWENYFNSGKINPVAGIFLAKNNYGYRDQQNVEITAKVSDNTDFTADEIRAKYTVVDAEFEEK